MKKYLLFVTLIGVCLFTGCDNEEKTMSCTYATLAENVTLSSTYDVIYKGKYVEKVKIVETITSANEDTLETYKESIEKLYEPYKDVKYYDYNINIDGNELKSIVDIDYSKVDTNKIIEINSANEQIIKKGKIKIDDIEELYKNMGATCKK